MPIETVGHLLENVDGRLGHPFADPAVAVTMAVIMFVFMSVIVIVSMSVIVLVVMPMVMPMLVIVTMVVLGLVLVVMGELMQFVMQQFVQYVQGQMVNHQQWRHRKAEGARGRFDLRRGHAFAQQGHGFDHQCVADPLGKAFAGAGQGHRGVTEGLGILQQRIRQRITGLQRGRQLCQRASYLRMGQA